MQKNRKDSENFSTDESNQNLDSSFVSEAPELDGSQSLMLSTLMFIQIFSTMVSISLGPLYSPMAKAYKISDSKVHLLYTFTIVSQIIAYIPMTHLLGKFGMKIGLGVSLLGATVGCGLCCMINTNYTIFQVGYFLTQFCLTSVHVAKGNFVNMFYVEKQVSLRLIFFLFENSPISRKFKKFKNSIF